MLGRILGALGFGKSPLDRRVDEFRAIVDALNEGDADRANALGKAMFNEVTDDEGVREDVASFLSNFRIGSTAAKIHGCSEVTLALRAGAYRVEGGEVKPISPHYFRVVQVAENQSKRAFFRTTASGAELVVTDL